MEHPTTLAAASEKYAGDPGDACSMVIFGASGDLTKRKLIPALYNLAKENLLSREFALIGFARPEMTTEAIPRQMQRRDPPVCDRPGRSGRVALVCAP